MSTLSGAAVDGRRALSVVIPVYNNEGSLEELCDRLRDLKIPGGLEMRIVFVVDGSPDGSAALLRRRLETFELPSTLVVLSRNFGAFAAIRVGLEHATGDYFVVMAADMQEPPELVGRFAEELMSGHVDVVLGRREGRADPWASRLFSSLFWRAYRRFVQPSMPPGGIDVFGCNRAARHALLDLDEANSSLVGQLLWIGFRRSEVGYERRPRRHGKSSWTLHKKLRYATDSIFSFTDLPVRLMFFVGLFGSLAVVAAAIVILVAWLMSLIDVPGYTPLMLSILFVGLLITLGFGIVGSYVWRAYENTKQRPLAVTQSVTHNFSRTHD